MAAAFEPKVLTEVATTGRRDEPRRLPTDVAAPKAQPEPVLEAIGAVKDFPGVRALDSVDFRLLPGEIHAVMGENGAGKSTLIKVLTGVHDMDRGEMRLAGRSIRVTNPLHAQQVGISTVYQEVNLCPNLSVAENIFIGREPRRFGVIRWAEMRRRAERLLGNLEVEVDVSATLSAYSLAIQQLVAIARALDVSARVLILDEPTSSLDRGEVARLFDVMRRLKDDGIAILFVSHFLDQVFQISDRVTVLRNGKLVGEYRTNKLTRMELVAKMIGKDELRTLQEVEELPKRDLAALEGAAPFMEARDLGRRRAVEPCNLTIHPREVVGLAGLLGSGRTELARLLFGADRPDWGEVLIEGEPVPLRSPRAATSRGVAFCPENRKAEGLLEDLTVRDNIVLALQAAKGWTRPIPRRRRDELARAYITALNITPPNPDLPVRNLSGGNQQRVLLARWLLIEPRLLILDEPTRGIDVGAKAEIQRLVVSLADQGMAVLFISAELDEVLRLSHKIGVLRDRHLVDELAGEAVTEEQIMATIAGHDRQ